MSKSARHNLSHGATFDEHDLQYPFASGRLRLVAKGVYTNGPRCHQPCVSKWFKKGGVYEETFFEKDLQAVDKAQEFIDAFNDLQLANTIHLNRPAVWEWEGGRFAGQKNLVEPFINDYQKFNSNSGWACRDGGWCEVMQALSHFSYHKSGGQMVLCDLQGGMMSRGRGAVLTDPAICSRSRSYGVTDLGLDGISTFFARHRCNSYCQSHWQKPRNLAVYYKSTPGTTMELYNAGHGGGGYGAQAPIYEEDSDDYYDSSDSDDY